MSKAYEGRQAFLQQGVSARNPYGRDTVEYLQFREGISEASFRACEQVLEENVAYHLLSIRDNEIDREWAEKMLKRA